MATAKMTARGQVTIPREIRKALGSDIIEFTVTDDGVLIHPVKSVAGSLGSYARKTAPFQDVRDEVWSDAVRRRVKK